MSYVYTDFGLDKHGDQFKLLDELLTAWGFPSEHLLDTPKDRIARWQRSIGNTPDGILGPKQWARLAAGPPSVGIDLTNWKLTLPTDATGDGKADEIKQPTLANFKFTPYFYPRADGGQAFRAPCDGATTTGSTFPRSELREMTNNGAGLAAWDTDDGSVNSLYADLAFTHLPEIKPHVVGMQIHDAADDVTVLRLEGGDLYVTKGDAKFKKIVAGYVLGTRIKVKFEASAAGIRWFLNGTHVATIDGTYEGCYAKAGVYTQASSRVSPTSDKYGTGYGEVVIYALEKKVA